MSEEEERAFLMAMISGLKNLSEGVAQLAKNTGTIADILEDMAGVDDTQEQED